MTDVHPWLQVYLAVGIVTLVISGCLALRECWRRRGDLEALISLLEDPDPRTQTFWYRVRARVLTPVLVALFLVVLWPVVPWMKFQDRRHARGAAREEAERVFKVHQSHLRQRCSVEEVESREIVQDPLNAVPPVAFGHLNPMWARLKAQMQAGDELWTFKSRWQDDLGRQDQRTGYVLWRECQPAAHMLTGLEQLEDRPVGPTEEDVHLDFDEIRDPAFLHKGAD